MMTDFCIDSLPNSPDIFPADHLNGQLLGELLDFPGFADGFDEWNSNPLDGMAANMENLSHPTEDISTVPTLAHEACSKKSVGGSSKKRRSDADLKVAFRTMSEVEIMDDGYKWRKYGKKSVKNSPNPRNYYRCSHGDCNVKKKVERDREDSRFVVTTYEGKHNHADLEDSQSRSFYS